MGKKENPVAQRSRTWLTKSLLSLMEEKPYDSISILEISTRSDLVRQTFYQNFKSKDDVLKQYLDSLFKEFSAIIKKEDVSSIRSLSLFYFEYWKEHKKFLDLLIKNDLSHLLVEQFTFYLADLAAALSNKKTEASEEASATKTKYAYVYLAGALTHLLLQWTKDGQQITSEEMAFLISEIQKGRYFEINID